MGATSFLLSLFLLAAPAFAQDNPMVYEITDFSGGMNTFTQSTLLKDNEGPLFQNVILDKHNALTKRQGYTKINATAIGDGASDVNAVYPLERSNGTRYCVAFSSTTGSFSTDSCQSFTVFISTLTRSLDVNCDALQDRLYCVNNSYNFYFDGRTSASVVSGITGDPKFIRVFRNRCFVAGTTANPSRVYYSALGDCTSWTTATDYFDISPEDGDVVTGIGESFYDMLPFYKKFSTLSLRGATPATWQLVTVNRQIGAKNHRSIATFNNVQLFDSLGANGGKPGIYGFDGITVKEVSTKLRNEIDFLDTFRATAGHRNIDSLADWSDAIFDPRAMSATRESGYMQSTYTAYTDDLGVDFALGSFANISTQTVPGSLALARDTAAFTNGNFDSGDFTGWDTVGAWTMTNRGATTEAAACSVDITSGTDFMAKGQCHGTAGSTVYQFDLLDPGTGAAVKSCTATMTCGGKCNLSSSTCDGAVDISDMLYFTLDTRSITNPNAVKLKIASASGFVLTTTNPVPIGRQVTVRLKGQNAVSPCNDPLNPISEIVDTCGSTNYASSGTFISRPFEMSISTPIWGLFNASVSSSTTETNATFKVRSASGCASSFSSFTTQTSSAEIVAPSRSCLQYEADLQTTVSSKTPTVAFVNVSAGSTGTWTSNELFLSNNITSWGLFQAAETKSGLECAITYGIKSSTFSGGTASSNTFTSVLAGGSIGISTGAYVVIKATFTIGVATETCKVDAIEINWAEGSQAKSATAKVFDNRYHYGAQSLGGARNDLIYVLDSNGAWTKWTGVSPRYLNVVNQNFVMAGSSASSAGFLYRLYDTESDDGGPISARWVSKDFTFGKISHLKAVDRVGLIHRSNTSMLNLLLKADTGLQQNTYNLDLSTGTAFRLQNVVVEPAINGNTFRLELNNNAASQPWEALGLQLYLRDLGLTYP